MKPLRVTDSVFGRAVDADRYVMERKYDGWRALIMVGDKEVSLWTREHRKIDAPLNLLVQLQSLAFPVGTVLDSEIWNPLKRGAWNHKRDIQCKLTVWDVMRVGTTDVSAKPLMERRSHLESLIQVPTEDIALTELLPAKRDLYEEILAEAEQHKNAEQIRSGFIHGVVIKRKASPRRDHSTRCAEHPDWLKIVFWAQN